MYLYAERCSAVPLPPESGWLSESERARAQRIRHTRTRNEFVTGRRLARLVLSRLLGRPPQEVRFEIGELGQPRLENCGQEPGSHFSIAHRTDCASSRSRRVTSRASASLRMRSQKFNAFS